MVNCPACGGLGFHNVGGLPSRDCVACDGTGQIVADTAGAHDRVIWELVNALDSIRRHTDQADRSFDFIRGCAAQAITNCNARRVRNKDGYLVVNTGGN